MLKKTTALCLAFLLGLTCILTGVSARAQVGISLAPPQNVTVRSEGTLFIIEWQNPKSIEAFAKSCYDNYNGPVTYIIDWRVNGGEWHLDKEVPSGDSIYGFYGHISYQFFANVYVDDYNSYFASKAEISKLLVGLPYSESISQWLKTNNIEFRIRYYCEYWDDTSNSNVNLHSPFSNTVLVGAVNPTGTGAQTKTDDFGLPQPLSTADAPESLAVSYMTLDLRWKVPESIKAAEKMGTAFATAHIDWKINNGPWHDTLEESKTNLEASTWFTKIFGETDMDKDGYVTVTLSRQALGIEGSVQSWLSSNTCYFRVRYVIIGLGEKELISPYSNTAVTGKGTPAPLVPKLDKPLQLDAMLESKWEKHIINFTWIAPPGISEVNKSTPVITYIDYKPQGGKWQTELKGMRGSDGYSDDLGEKYDMYFDQGQVQGVYSFRIYFACQYAPSKWAFSDFSNVLTVDFSSGKVTNPEKADANAPYKGASSWAIAELDKAVGYGLITDRIKNDMQAPITREEFSEVVVKLYGKYTGTQAVYTPPAPFADTDNVEIYKANQLGIVLGTDIVKKLFTPKQSITREQIAAMLYRAVKKMSLEVNLSTEGAEVFKDIKSIYPNFLESVRFLNKNGIMKANNGIIGPTDTASREQAVMMAVRIYENFK